MLKEMVVLNGFKRKAFIWRIFTGINKYITYNIYIIVFIVTLNQFNASLLHKSINFYNNNNKVFEISPIF